MADTTITSAGAPSTRRTTLVSTTASTKRVMATAATADIATNTPHLHGRPEQTNDLRDHRRRMVLVVITAIMTLFWTGAFLGWGPMQLLLEEDGAFEDQCLEKEPQPCPAQTTKLLNVNFFAQLTMIFSPVLGIWVDLYGPFFIMSLSTIFLLVGFGGLILAVTREVDVLLYISFVFVGMMMNSSHQNIMQVGMLFRGKTQQRVISVMNALFDSGALTYLGLWAIENSSGVKLELLIGAYLLAGTCFFGAAMYLWHVVVPVSAGENDGDPLLEPDLNAAAEERALNGYIKDRLVLTGTNDTIKEMQVFEDNLNRRIEEPKRDCNSDNQAEGRDVAMPPKDSPTLDDKAASNKDGCYVLISERPILDQLKSKQFILLLSFYSFYSCLNIFALGTARDFLAYLGDDETGNLYLSLFVLMTPVSLLGLPFIDFILNRYGYHAGLQSINVLALLYSVVKVSSDSLNVQVFGFLLFSMFRCFLFSLCFSFVPTFLTGNVVGRGIGVMVMFQGLTALVNIPLASWAVNGLDGNFFLPNLLYTIATIPFFYVAWLMGAGIKVEKRASILLSEKRESTRRLADTN
jgi:hypothetical protein